MSVLSFYTTEFVSKNEQSVVLFEIICRMIIIINNLRLALHV